MMRFINSLIIVLKSGSPPPSPLPSLPSYSEPPVCRSYVFDGIRSSLPKLDLDSAFSSKNEIADNVKNSLADLMDDYGYRIVNVLIIDLDPDNSVKNAMNEINGTFFLLPLFFFC